MSSGIPAGRLVELLAAATESQPISRPAINLRPGPLLAALVVSDVPVTELPAGTRLRIGASAVLELLEPLAPPASGWAGVREVDPAAPSRPARVCAGGGVAMHDPVVIDAVPVPVEDALDLHPFLPGEVEAVAEEYLTHARGHGLREVRLIHGRGRGVQREIVRRLLARLAFVSGFEDAPPERGGWGATIVRLAPRGQGPAPG